MTKCILLILLLPLFISCVSSKKAIYFNNITDSLSFTDPGISDPVIRKNDLLSISVSSRNPETSKIFNLPNETKVRSSTSTGEVLEPAGYMVDSDGYINFLILGRVKAEGLTKKQLTETLKTLLVQEKLLMDPIIEVRHLNFEVTVLGEVTKPTVITVRNEKITLLDALGIAGDITINGKRTNVMVIRSQDGKRVAKRVDLTSENIFSSDLFYLRSNDIVYVEPTRAKVASASRFNQLIPVILSTLSLGIIVIDRLAR